MHEENKLQKLYDPRNGQMRVAGLMSGSGSNLRKIIEYERKLTQEQGKSPYKMVVIFSDTGDSKAGVIGEEYDIPVVTHDIHEFYAARRRPRHDMALREEFDAETVVALSPFGAQAAAYGGYMSIATRPLIDAFLGVNVHPADLSITNPDGSRKYRGDHAVRDAILAGEKELKSSTHIIETEVDGGRILIVSSPLEVKLGADFKRDDKEKVRMAAEQHQTLLKECGDWVIFPRTLHYIAEGRFAQDEKGALYFDGKQIPNGVQIDNVEKR